MKISQFSKMILTNSQAGTFINAKHNSNNSASYIKPNHSFVDANVSSSMTNILLNQRFDLVHYINTNPRHKCNDYYVMTLHDFGTTGYKFTSGSFHYDCDRVIIVSGSLGWHAHTESSIVIANRIINGELVSGSVVL